MSTRNTVIAAAIIILASALTGLLLWNQLPVSMAAHWDALGQANGYTSRLWGVLLLPLITAGMLALFLVIPVIDPLKANIRQFRETFNIFILLMTVFLTYVHVLSLVWNLGVNSFNMSSAMLPAVGLLFIFIGPIIGKAKRNFFIGIRTPWTLSSDTVWEKTHRLGGKLFIAAGVLALLGIFFPASAHRFLVIPMVSAAIISVVYSYLLYRRETGG